MHCTNAMARVNDDFINIFIDIIDNEIIKQKLSLDYGVFAVFIGE